MENTIMTVKEMADVMRISLPTAYELIHSVNGPPKIVIGRTLRIPVDGFNEWLARESKQKTRVV